MLRASPAPLAQAAALERILGELFRRHASLGPRAGRWGRDEPHPARRTEAADVAAVRRVREYLDAQAHGGVSLADLVRATGVGESRLLRLFRRHVGLPPYAYLLTRRVEAAKRRLDAGEPAAQVALACGFADQSHLTRHFTRIVGLPPVQYARRPRVGVAVCEPKGARGRA
ncbi:MAG: helix-turn-helix domain-containing protein [Gemmatimonadaceae bacterium]